MDKLTAYSLISVDHEMLQGGRQPPVLGHEMLQGDRQIPVLVWIADPDRAKLDLLNLVNLVNSVYVRGRLCITQ